MECDAGVLGPRDSDETSARAIVLVGRAGLGLVGRPGKMAQATGLPFFVYLFYSLFNPTSNLNSCFLSSNFLVSKIFLTNITLLFILLLFIYLFIYFSYLFIYGENK